jgi:DNA-directed RNA polymerase subunit RPC12/RpoP
MLSPVESLSDDRRRSLLSRLIKGEDLTSLGKDFDLVVPKRITVEYNCPSCGNDFKSRVMTGDMKGMSKYISCPDCRKSSYLNNIGVSQETTRIDPEGLDIFNT